MASMASTGSPQRASSATDPALVHGHARQQGRRQITTRLDAQAGPSPRIFGTASAGRLGVRLIELGQPCPGGAGLGRDDALRFPARPVGPPQFLGDQRLVGAGVPAAVKSDESGGEAGVGNVDHRSRGPGVGGGPGDAGRVAGPARGAHLPGGDPFFLSILATAAKRLPSTLVR